MDDEIPVVFSCAGEQLLGVVHCGNPEATVGIVIVVGGPQYRVGSHRQFVLMARQLAAGGIPVLRFDYRGMGDSSGERRTFGRVEQDIRVAIGCLMDKSPNIKHVTLMGLCDAASIIMMYGERDKRVTGLILMNPWVQTEDGFGENRLRHYYFPRLLQKSFWRKVLSGKFAPISSMGGLMRSMRATIPSQEQGLNAGRNARGRFVERMLLGLERFKYPVLLLLSGRDLSTREFLRLRSTDGRWQKAIQGSKIHAKELPDADHTLSARKDLDLAASQCLQWLMKLQESN